MEELLKQLIDAVYSLKEPSSLAWAPVALSAIAVIIAVYIPTKIAKRQNDIAVFDKLYDSYTQLQLLKSFVEAIRNFSFSSNTENVQIFRELVCMHFETAFGYKPILDNSGRISETLAAMRINETKVHVLPLIISKDANQKKECQEALINIYELFFLYITGVVLFELDKVQEVNANAKMFINSVDEFILAYAERIEEMLMILK